MFDSVRVLCLIQFSSIMFDTVRVLCLIQCDSNYDCAYDNSFIRYGVCTLLFFTLVLLERCLTYVENGTLLPLPRETEDPL